MLRKTLVLGASMKEWRYSNMAVQRLAAKGHPVIAVGAREGMIGAIPIAKEIPSVADIDTVSIYLNEQNQKMYADRILELKPKRIIFNPGAENPELERKAEAAGIEVLEACTLTMLSVGFY